MTTSKTGQQPRRIWLLTLPRTASNLLVKMLNLPEQDCHVGGSMPKLGGYHFFPSAIMRNTLFGTGTSLNEWPEEEMTKWKVQAQADFDEFQDLNEKTSQDGKIAFSKDHVGTFISPYYASLYDHGTQSVEGLEPFMATAQGVSMTRSALNKTLLPDEYLRTMTPVFLIRHPAKQLSSHYRKALENPMDRSIIKPLPFEATTTWMRSLYDFYAEHFAPGSEWPLVLEADDIMTSPELVKKFAAKTGMDPEKVVFSWTKTADEEVAQRSKPERVMLSTLLASDKIDMGKVAGTVDIEREAVKWREEFGEDVGREVENRVRACMSDYEFLRSRRFVLG